MTEDAPKVRHRAPAVFDYSTLIQDAVTFYVNNEVFDGWKNVSVTRTLNSVSGQYSLTLLDRYTPNNLSWKLIPGGRAHLHLGREAVFEGWIETMDVAFAANATNMTIKGRDRTGDLVDCAVTGQNEYQNLTLAQVAEKLCAPFGLKVLTLSDVGAPFPNISVKPGEKVYDLLQRLARQRGIIMHSTVHGNLILTQRGRTRAQTELVEGVNILNATANYDNTERFSQYEVKAQNDGLIGTKPKEGTEAQGRASDSGVGRFRPTVILAETAGDNAMAKNRANWEATYRAAKSSTVTITVADWRESNGDLWDVNKLVYLRSPRLGVSDQFLINSVRYSQSEQRARTADLELIRKDSYQPKPVIEKDDDPLAALGIT